MILYQENINYGQVYAELYIVLNKINQAQRKLIPQTLMDNLLQYMDKNYKFIWDNSKDLLEQNWKTQTKALLVEIYEKYLSPIEEKEFWKKYDTICVNMIDKKQYSLNGNTFMNMFNYDKKEIDKSETTLIKYDNVKWYIKILKFCKRLFKKYN